MDQDPGSRSTCKGEEPCLLDAWVSNRIGEEIFWTIVGIGHPKDNIGMVFVSTDHGPGVTDSIFWLKGGETLESLEIIDWQETRLPAGTYELEVLVWPARFTDEREEELRKQYGERLHTDRLSAKVNFTILPEDEQNNYYLLIEKLKSHSTTERQEAIFKLHNYSKSVIPSLISEIDDDRKIFLGLNNPLSSTFTIESIVNYTGILAAYTIELILAREMLYKDDSIKPERILGRKANCIKNYIYDSGVITRTDHNDLNFEDMQKIRSLYERWWEENKSKTIETLRREYLDGSEPLKGSNYFWE
jgi:hypothetical protein